MFRKKVIELVDVGALYLWGHFIDGDLNVCNEVCREKIGRRSK